MNFNIIENGPSPWDKQDEIIRLYNAGIPIKEIMEIVKVSSTTFNKIIRKAKEEGRVTPRRKPYRKKPRVRDNPKFYYRNRPNGGYCVAKRGVFYGYVRTARQAEEFVRRMKECDWDYDKRYEIKKEVMSSA